MVGYYHLAQTGILKTASSLSYVRYLMTPELHWTAYLSALLPPTVVVLGSFIAYQQWFVAQYEVLEESKRKEALTSSSRFNLKQNDYPP